MPRPLKRVVSRRVRALPDGEARHCPSPGRRAARKGIPHGVAYLQLMGTDAAGSSAMAPWWVRMTRWTQTSLGEAATHERGLLSVLPAGHRMAAQDVRVGPGPQDWLHTITNCPLPPESLMHDAKRRGSCAPASKVTPAAAAAAQHQADPAADAPASPAPAGGAPFVLMPGYGAGAGFYFRNLGDLAAAVRLYAVDWLGTGLSGRPRFTARTREQAESFFIDSLASWRQAVGLGGERMVLVGHSLGGYLAAAYALAHPDHVEHLVLVCPAGVPKAPEDWQAKFLGSSGGTLRGRIFKSAMWAWEAGVTPHSLVRALGPLGPGLCERYVANRFTHHGDGLRPEEQGWFQRYFYSIIAQPGSGEFALRHLLAPGAWAHEPLSSRLRDLRVPVTFIYGAADWMRPEHAVELVQALRKERALKAQHDLHVEIIQDAGHFVFIDQPSLFNEALLTACRKHVGHFPSPTPAKQEQDSDRTSTSWGPKPAGV